MKYEIWQVKDEFVCDYAFKGYTELVMSEGFFKDKYHKVYEGEVDTPSEKVYEVLEELFEKFNIARPTDFEGWAMSMSDIVVIGGESYYCDRFGWQKVDFKEVA